jgi:hypothetical protein
MTKSYGFWAAGAALALVCSASVPAFAHHGWGWYSEEPGELTGTVEAINLGGAHGQLKVRSGGQVWDVVLAPPNRNERAGLTEGILKVGTQVTARGHKWKEAGRLEIKTERLVVGDKTYNLYPERD